MIRRLVDAVVAWWRGDDRQWVTLECRWCGTVFVSLELACPTCGHSGVFLEEVDVDAMTLELEREGL